MEVGKERQVTAELGEEVQEQTKLHKAWPNLKAGLGGVSRRLPMSTQGSEHACRGQISALGSVYHSYGVYWPCTTPRNMATVRHYEQGSCPMALVIAGDLSQANLRQDMESACSLLKVARKTHCSPVG